MVGTRAHFNNLLPQWCPGDSHTETNPTLYQATASLIDPPLVESRIEVLLWEVLGSSLVGDIEFLFALPYVRYREHGSPTFAEHFSHIIHNIL